MGISFGSINTGLPKDIVQQIMKAERMPLQKMEMRKAKHSEKMALVEQLTSLVEAVRGDVQKNGNPRQLRELTSAGRDDILDITLDKNIAQPGTHQFEVVQLAQKSSAMTSGFEDPDNSYVGVGFIQYTLPNGDTKDVYIDSDNASLKGISKLVNGDRENGLTAAVINDGSDSETPWRLVLAFDGTGDNNRAEFPYFYFVDGEQDFYIEQERPAHDAIVKLNGFEIEIPNNKTDSLIPGVTLDLLKAAPGEEFTIKIAEDVEKITEKIKNLVAELNAVLAFIKEQNTLDEKSDTTRTLGGDLILQTLESRIRASVFKDVKTDFGFKRIGELGLTFQRDGSLQLDDKKFENGLAANYEMVSQLLTGKFTIEGGKTDGFMDYIGEMAYNSLRNPDGLLHSRKRSMRIKIDQIDRRIEDRERHLKAKERNLKNKFSRLEATVSRIQSQGAGLSALGASAQGAVQLG
ncbi:MAG: flagellar filament capping protein FliD [Bacteriovoracaceae bacterium]|nr:flagellar filament capping protein FliD [Bacteriovoracaceae bacterium]